MDAAELGITKRRENPGLEKALVPDTGLLLEVELATEPVIGVIRVATPAVTTGEVVPGRVV